MNETTEIIGLCAAALNAVVAVIGLVFAIRHIQKGDKDAGSDKTELPPDIGDH